MGKIEFLQIHHRGRLYYQVVERFSNNKIRVLSNWRQTKHLAWKDFKCQENKKNL